MPRTPKPSKGARPAQGARLLALRRAAGITQTELAAFLGEPQANITFWEWSDKPPRSDVLPKLAQALGVGVEALLETDAKLQRAASRPPGKVRQTFEEVSRLPRRQQDKIVEMVSALIEQYKRKAS